MDGTGTTCCGTGGSWATAGKPLVNGCQLCPNSPTYWQGKLPEPYVAVPLGADDAAVGSSDVPSPAPSGPR
ncbi:hypothetical protein GCM10009687_05940 [Asanoa iriomotensis]|uniref:Uncharacterized protein n=1 Tax=Asanoa iriomotensis TaxID=234613 RepID=A0ABQ4C1I5_9ACTN|nr:hypothetical protein Air01nite_27400 [Asanoa iriomotensis]